MKTNFKNIFVVMFMAIAAVANAQTASDSLITISEEERALALSVYTNGECFETPEQDDNVLCWDGHGGLYLLTAGVAEFHNFSNNDGVTDTGSKSCFGGDLGIGYRMVRTGWFLAGFGEVYGGVNSSYHVENRVVNAHMHFGALVGVENSHGIINFGVGLKYIYDNAVSENGNATPWRGNKHRLEPFARFTTKIFSFKTHKVAKVNNKNILVRGLREVHLFGEVSYNLTNQIDKSWDDQDAAIKGNPWQKDKCITGRIGLKFFIR